MALIASSSPAQTAAAAIPDPATVTVTDFSHVDSGTAKNGGKFFIFYSPSVTFAEAYADLAECRSFLELRAGVSLPGFIAWGEHHARKAAPDAAPVGLANAALNSIIAPKMERGLRNNKLRRCMEPRGYVRLAVPDAAWEQLNTGEERSIIARQAKLASGSRPLLAVVSE